jgi:hypothetical protein
VRLQSVDRGPGLIAYIERTAGATDAGSIERNILVARAAGLSATDFGGRDLVAMLRAKFARDGSVGDAVNLTTFGILALRAAAVAVPARTDGWLLAQQNHDGGFGFARRGGSSDVDDTGAALEALASVPGSRAAGVRARAIAYVRGQQDRDGGFPSQPGEGSNAQSTAWAVQGLDAAGVNPAGVRHAGGPSPLAYLQSLIGHDGAVAYARGQRQTPVWVTGEALMALAGKPLPLAPLPPLPAPAAKPTPAQTPKAPVTQQTSTTRSTSTGSAAPAAGATGDGTGGHGSAARHRAPAQAADSPATATTGDASGESAVIGAVVATAARTVAAVHALM